MKKQQFQFLTEVEVSYRSPVPAAYRPKITSSKDAEKVLRENWSDDMELLEECNVLFLSRANQVKGILRVSRGGTSGTIVDPKIIFAAALKGMASSIILAHNHPSNSLEPSQSDMEITRKLRKAGEILELPLLDHLILAPYEGYYSFADHGAL